jgi:hypothetical protein
MLACITGASAPGDSRLQPQHGIADAITTAIKAWYLRTNMIDLISLHAQEEALKAQGDVPLDLEFVDRVSGLKQGNADFDSR